MIDAKRRSFFKGSKQVNQQSLPWITSSKHFTLDCTRCYQCQSACEMQIIIVGDGGFPTIDFQKDGCSYCHQCAKACPENLFLPQEAEPWQQKIDISQACLAKKNVECRSCGDSCDTTAISFQLRIKKAAQPIVNLKDCNGCGACISFCPTNAITISTNEETDLP